MKRASLPLIVLWASIFARTAHANDAKDTVEFAADFKNVLNTHCIRCHKEKSDSDVRFDNFSTLTKTARLELLAKVEEQLLLRHMPPEGARKLSEDERRQMTEWLGRELKKNKVATFEDKLRYPDYGNWVDHKMLFSGEIKEKPYTPARRWMVSPQIFNERVYDALGLDVKDREYYRPRNLYGITSPFTLPERSGVRYFDLAGVDGGHFLVMQANTAWMADKLVGSARIRNGEPLETVFPNKSDRWYPQRLPKSGKAPTPGAIDKVIVKTSPPTDDELGAAIQAYFAKSLQRPANDVELKNYLELTRGAIELSGNAEGIRQMLIAVLLESEFVYRLEFGAGEPDEFGRKLLSPREASYAIAYSLGDRNPDPDLVDAAQKGRLLSKADYEREVRRLLADVTLFSGEIEPGLGNNHYKSHVATHPKLVRFFREFFGYPLAIKIFKDVNRSNGFYQNAGRGSTGTGGRLVDEADMFVERYVRQDKRVFENLLTGEEFFVAPVAGAGPKIDALNEVYERFKGKNWKVDLKTKKSPTPLSDEDLAFIRKRLVYNANEYQLHVAMTHIEKFKKKGLNPNPIWQYAFGTQLTTWTHAYNIDPFQWEYPREQPIPLANRKGILTHPAWLIAHAQNSATDPVRRGRWVREKLLAGPVPNVPITVDAQIPENPHKSLRQRLDMVTSKQECWKCHQHMNPVGLPFESFDDFGRFRTAESLEHPESLVAKTKTKYGADTFKTVPVVSTGTLSGSDDDALDGDVRDALDMIDRLAKSDRVRQSIIRHAFRFFLGRNERLSDSQTLIDADRAYVRSGGSFKEVVVSLLTSDSFRFRK